MIETNTRTLAVLLALFVALVMVAQSAQHVNGTVATHYPVIVDKAPVVPVKLEAPVKKVSHELMPIPLDKCSVSFVNGGNYILATPKACAGVSVDSIRITVSEKTCGASSKTDFQSLSNSTVFKGDYGFYLGQGKNVQCIQVDQIVGKYL